MDAQSVLSLDNPIFRLYATYGAAVTLKMMCLSLYVSRFRITRKVFANLEDASGKQKYVRNDDDIERGLRCHRNDLENVIPFLILGLMYVTTDPSVFAATWHFRVFVASRFFHTVAYLTPLPQPCRALSFAIGLVANISMGVQVLMNGTF
ncbi:microsomal glutathione S-transferase 1-like [Asterias rubens]|uniref:microsomal glutathione S-transferase 1-like n=1 Tax=Asterias rubens TaxID=7604 RepID=UPI00145591C6|nr:microsomal glutathione S-transferase 1-like [Asterias rubens]